MHPYPTNEQLVDDCIHGIMLRTCSICRDRYLARPKGTAFQRWMAPRREAAAAEATRIRATGAVRPFTPADAARLGIPFVEGDDVWDKDEWQATRLAITKRLRAMDRDRYDGRTCGPKDRSIKPINRTRR